MRIRKERGIILWSRRNLWISSESCRKMRCTKTSNASVRYDPETGKLAAFSRKQQIVRTKDVDATSKFLDYVDTLDAEKFQKYPDYVFFGEWMTRHRVPYPEKYLNIWIMYDVYDLKADGYLPQKQVKALAAEVGVPYIHVLYDGPFVDWDHCRSFMRITKYTDGDCEEGIIVKNMSKLNNPDSRAPFVLKIVNEKFSEMKGVWNGRMEADCPGDRKKNLCGLREGRGGGRGSLRKTLR